MAKTHTDAPLRLITIPMSHYCEKARWGLERLGLAYFEERHLQIFHYPRTWWVSRGPNVPVLVDGSAVISDSTRILQHLDRYAADTMKLYPQDAVLRREVEYWEDRFDELLGVESRRWVYYHMLPYPSQALLTAAQGAPAFERRMAPFGYGLMKLMFRKLMDVTPENVVRGVGLCRELLAETDRLLADGRRYLLGARFTAADLALASLLAPFVLPRNYGIRLPTLEEAPTSMHADIRWFQATRSGDYVLRLYDEERTTAHHTTNSAITGQRGQ